VTFHTWVQFASVCLPELRRTMDDIQLSVAERPDQKLQRFRRLETICMKTRSLVRDIGVYSVFVPYVNTHFMHIVPAASTNCKLPCVFGPMVSVEVLKGH
jgi:hypothetical protein